MRDGRRQRLGLQTGTEGTVQDTYLDRILSDVEVAGEPNILSLDPDANVRTTDQRYVSDAYNYYLGGGYDASQDDFPIQADDIIGGGGGDGGASSIGTIPLDQTGVTGVNTPFEQNLLDQGVGVQAEPGAPISAPGEGMLTQEAIDDLADYPVTPANMVDPSRLLPQIPEVVAQDPTTMIPQLGSETSTYIGGEKTLEEAGAGIDDMYATDYQGGEPQTIKTTSMDPTGMIPQISDQLVSEQDTSESLYQKAKNYLGEKTANAIDWTSLAVKGLINKYVGGPVTLLFDALGAMDLPGGPTLQTSKAQSIGLVGENEYQDKYGINTQSLLGDYDEYNINRVEELEGIVADQKSRGLTNTLQMKELEDRKEYNTISGVGGDVEGDQPGMTIAEELGLMDKIDPGLRVEQKEDIVDAPVDIVDVQAVEEAIERAEAMEAAKIAEIDRQNRVREAEAAEAERARKQAAHNAMIRKQQASVHGGGGGDGGGSGKLSSGMTTGQHAAFRYAKGGRVRYSRGGIVDLL